MTENQDSNTEKVEWVRLKDAMEIAKKVSKNEISLADAYCELMGKSYPDTNACKWEADHQQRILKEHGLDEEFPYGCDAIDIWM